MTNATIDREVPDYRYMRAYASMVGMPIVEHAALIQRAVDEGAPERAVKYNELAGEWVTVDDLPVMTKGYVISLVEDDWGT